MKVYLCDNHQTYVFEAVTESEKKKMRQLLRQLKCGNKIEYQRGLPDENSSFQILFFHFGERNEYLKVQGDSQESKKRLLDLHREFQHRQDAPWMIFLRGESPRGGPYRAYFCF